MSSKVRLVYLNSRVGKWYTGRNVLHSLHDEAARLGMSLPLATQKKPVWERILWMFDHAKSEGSKLFIWREPRRTPAWRSPYVQLAGTQLQRIGRQFSATQIDNWEKGRRRERREIIQEVARRNSRPASRGNFSERSEGLQVAERASNPAAPRPSGIPAARINAGDQAFWYRVAGNVLVDNAQLQVNPLRFSVPNDIQDEIDAIRQRERDVEIEP